MSIAPPDLPASYTWGFVTCQIVQAIADTADDPDRLPESRPAVGSVTFTPTQPLRRVVGPPPALVTHGPAVAQIGPDGRIVDDESLPGIWLVTGVYRVGFQVTKATIPGFEVEVRPEHTLESPLDLAVASPYTPPSGATVTTMLVPSGGVTGEVLTLGSDGLLEWATVSGAGGSAPDASASVKGVLRLAGDLAGTAASPTVPGLAGKADASHTHVIADVTDYAPPSWPVSGTPAVIAAGADAASARTAIGAGTSNFSGAYADLTGKPTIPTDGAYKAVNAQTGTTYTLVAADVGKLVTLSNAAAITLTVPASTLVSGQRVDVLVLGAGMVTVVGASGVTVNATPSAVSRAQYSALTVVALSASSCCVVGDLA